MSQLSAWLEQLSTLQLLVLLATVSIGLVLLTALLGWVLVRMGLRRPTVVEKASKLAERGFGVVKRPITVVVLDEVAAVLATGHYTQNISAALEENRDQLKALVAEKVRQDPNVRLIGRLPGYDTVVSEVSETTLRVIIEMLQDPRTDALVNDLLRNNLTQIKQAVREHAPEQPADPPRRTQEG